MEKILVIEDNKDYQFLIQTSLGKDYRVVIADTGNSGVDMAKEHRPDLILLDISLGEVDGFEVCHRLRAQKETEKTPIIFLSSSFFSGVTANFVNILPFEGFFRSFPFA